MRKQLAHAPAAYTVPHVGRRESRPTVVYLLETTIGEGKETSICGQRGITCILGVRRHFVVQ